MSDIVVLPVLVIVAALAIIIIGAWVEWASLKRMVKRPKKKGSAK